ncbi:MAG: TrkA C-terminal domain-containing protein [Bacilli bacterium]
MIWILTIFIAIFMTIVEFFTVIFMLTGLSYSKSKFQVISMLTSTGFTTKESELIMLDPKRRKFAQNLIIFGYCATVTIVSMLVTSLNTSNNWYEYLLAIIAIVAFLIMLNSKSFRKIFDPKIEKFGSKFLYDEADNYLIILETLHEKIVGKIKLKKVPEEFINKKIGEMKINNKYGIQLLGIERDRKTLKITKDSSFENDDLIILYGDKDIICKALKIVKTSKKDKRVI